MLKIGLFMFRLQTVVQENYSIQTQFTKSAERFILKRDYRHIIAAIYRFHKINSADIIRLWLFKSGITILILNKDDLEFVTEFSCLLGHPLSSNMHSFHTFSYIVSVA